MHSPSISYRCCLNTGKKLVLIATVEWRNSAEKHIEKHAKTPDVAFLIVIPIYDFWWKVDGCSDKCLEFSLNVNIICSFGT
jgi:hypothetical protein